MPHGRRFRLGLFVIGAAVMFVSLLAFILQSSFDRERASFFILFTQNVKGMVIGSKVNFQGVPIGVVADMRFQDGKTLVHLEVDPTRACIQDVTMARMDRLLVTGQVTVELEGYGGEGKRLAPGSFIKPKEDPLHALTASLPEVVDQASSVLARLDRVLANTELMLGAKNQQHIEAILADCERAMRGFADGTLPRADALLGEARSTMQASTATMQRLDAELGDFLRESTGLMAGLRGPTQTSLASLRGTLEDARALLRQIKLAPDSFLFGVRPPAAPAGGER